MKSIRELMQGPVYIGLGLNIGRNDMGIRRQAREVALQALYMVDFNNDWLSYDPKIFYESFEVEKGSKTFADLLISGVIENKARLDSVITRASENWSIQRMARVDRALLRVSCFELCCLPDVPTNVTINEAVEIAKRYGSDESPMFINGVLDKIANYINQIKKADGVDSDKSLDDELFDELLVPIKVPA